MVSTANDTVLNLYSYLYDFIVVVLSIFFMVICFKINQSGDNQNFIARYFCLSFPIIIQSCLLFIIPFIFLVFLLTVFLDMETCYANFPTRFCEQYIDINVTHFETTSLDLIFISAFLLYFYLRLCRGFKIAAGLKDV